jgi:tetratricopeptide (TPR) repeat protein
MNFLSNLRERVPSGRRLYSLLAIVAMILAVLGDLLFVRFSIMPRWQARNELAAQLVAAEQELLEARRAEDEDPDKLKEQLEAAQAELDEVASLFFSESQAAEVLNNLYQCASESGVEILNLQSQPGPGEGSEEGEKKELYDVKTFQLRVTGSVPSLIAFVSRIEEATFESFAISNVSVAEGERLHNLTMDITLYTSPYSSGASEPVPPDLVPTATPVDLTQLEESLEAAWASKDWDQAIYLIDQILAVDPDYEGMMEKLYQAHVNYGAQLLEEGDRSDAIAQFDLALEIKPGGAEALAGLQQAAATPTPTLTVEGQLRRELDDAWEAEDWEEVIGLIERILEINPDDEDMVEKLYAAHVNYGYKLVDEERFEEAKEEFGRALVVKPGGAEAVTGLRELAGGIPSPTATPTSTPESTVYVVRRGDTLYSIARRYGTTVQAIMSANGLTNYNIYVGQQLYIPVR